MRRVPCPRIFRHRRLFKGGAGLRLSAIDRRILNTIQDDIPFSARPFKALSRKAGIGEAKLLKKLTELKKNGLIKDYAARINHKKLGYKSTLVGLKVPGNMLER